MKFNRIDFLSYINSFSANIKKDTPRQIFLHFYGLGNNEILSLEDLAIHLDLSNERIRQIRLKLIGELRKNLLFEELRDTHNFEFISTIKYLHDYLIELEVFSLTFIQELLNNKNSEIFLKKNEINLILDIFEFVSFGKVESSFTKSELIFINKNIKISHLKIAEFILRKLKESVLGISESKLLIAVKKTFKIVNNNQIKQIINSLVEIEAQLGKLLKD